jgi:hypothetical protein
VRKKLAQDTTVGLKYIKDIEERQTREVVSKRIRVRAMPLPRIFTAKIIMFLALIYWIIYLVPVYLESLEMGVTVVWFGAILLLWMKKEYASLLIAVIAGYNFIHDLLVELPQFKSTAVQVAAAHDIAPSDASISLIVLLALEAVFLFCFLYYAIYILPPKRMYAF